MARYYKGRKIAFKCLVGSHNHNLTTKTSDKDYKVLTYPTFEDLYKGYFFKDNDIGAAADYQVHDIRKLPELLAKSNVNFLEVLFSTETYSFNALHTRLEQMRNDIARMNLPHLFDACMGMYNKETGIYLRKMKEGDEAKAFKSAASAIRSAEFLIRFYNTDFNDFKAALWYEDETLARNYILGVKTGDFSKDMVDTALNNYEKAAAVVKKYYKEQPLDLDTAEIVRSLIELEVKEHIKNELL